MVDKELIGVLIWLFNPNDLFNAYSLVDFDYQERPGVDAVRFQYYGENMSSFEGAVQIGNSLDSTVIAGLWKFNKWKYDFQFLAITILKILLLELHGLEILKMQELKLKYLIFNLKLNFLKVTVL